MLFNGLEIDKIIYNTSITNKAYLNGQKLYSTENLILDNIDSAVLSLALKKLKSTATKCIRVRRSSDNAEMDIGFINDVLDTTAMLSFCGAGNGYVTIWYDQSGLGNNAFQTVASSQPQIVSLGILTDGLVFDGVNTYFTVPNTTSLTTSLQDVSVFVTIKPTSVNWSYLISKTNGSLSTVQWGIKYDATIRIVMDRLERITSVHTDILNIKTNMGFTWKNNELKRYINSINSGITVAYSAISQISNNIAIGKRLDSGYFKGNMYSSTIYSGNSEVSNVLNAEQQISK